jgi:hypothetical protein
MDCMNLLIVFLLGVLVGSMLLPKVVEKFSAYANQGILLENETNNLVNIRAIDNHRNIFRDITLTDLNIPSSRNNLSILGRTNVSVMTEQELNNYLLSNNITTTNMGKFYNIINRNVILPTSANHFVVYIVKDNTGYKALKITDIPNIEKIVNPTILNRLRNLSIYKDTEIEINEVGSLYSIRLMNKNTGIPLNAIHNNIKRAYGVDYIPFVVLKLE